MLLRVLAALTSLMLFARLSFAQTYTLNAASNGTTVNTCGGTFYDSGGSGGNYGNNESYTMTFCSNSANCVQLNFTSFRTQGGNDILYLYDGPNTSAPLIGNFSGTTSPGTVVSSTGCITVRFVSNGSNTRGGWAATVSCVACGTATNMSNTTVTTCSRQFYDSGGSAGAYGNNQTFVTTFTSANSTCIRVTFLSFNTQANRDSLTVFDGPTTASTRIGVFSGTTIPPSMLSTTGSLTFRFKSDASTTRAGWSAIIECEKCPSAPAASATYTQPTTGMSGSYAGAIMNNTCSGTFSDDGGSGSNYALNVNDIYRTFCPDQPGTALRVQFWSYSTEGGYDYLSILNGATQTSPEFGGVGGSTWSGTASTYQACLAAGLGPYTSTDQSGCLTFRFYSDNTITYPGWVATFDCVPYAAGPNNTDNNDCARSTGVCSNQNITDASTGPGLSSDITSGCIPTENYTNWYTIKIAAGGTLGFNLVPNSTADDYDFALFGPLNDCGGITAGPVRCSYGANTAAYPNTGMNSATNTSTNTNVCGVNNSGADDTEDGCGNGWVNSLNVNTGETYMLLVSKWTPGGSGFNLAWSLTNGASLDCSVTPLPIELLSFSAKAAKGEVKLAWITATEINNDYFTIERSRDGENFESIITVDGAGNSTQQLLYQSIDGEPLNGISYYRLKQTDYDGKFSYSDVVPVRFDAKQELFYLQPNPARDRVEVVFTASEDGRNHIRVTNYNGQIVYDRETDVHAGVNRHPVDIGSLPSGIYFVTLENEVEILQMRLVKD